MRWYKFSIVFTIGLFIELIVAIFSSVIIKENGEWLASLSLPFFAPHSPLFYGVLTEILYLFSALSLALYTRSSADLPIGGILTAAEGIAEIITLLFFFKFTYEITSFFVMTGTLLLSCCNTSHFLSKRDAAGIARFPVFIITLYLWSVLYCILMINFA